jgi:hypothetical protein
MKLECVREAFTGWCTVNEKWVDMVEAWYLGSERDDETGVIQTLLNFFWKQEIFLVENDFMLIKRWL